MTAKYFVVVVEKIGVLFASVSCREQVGFIVTVHLILVYKEYHSVLLLFCSI